jgi:hypothetical protein
MIYAVLMGKIGSSRRPIVSIPQKPPSRQVTMNSHGYSGCLIDRDAMSGISSELLVWARV